MAGYDDEIRAVRQAPAHELGAFAVRQLQIDHANVGRRIHVLTRLRERSRRSYGKPASLE